MRLGQSVQKFKIHFSPAKLCILLHLLSWENVSKALNPAGFTAFDKFLKTALMLRTAQDLNIRNNNKNQ